MARSLGRRLSPSIREDMPFAERMRENVELLRSYRRINSANSGFEQMLNDVTRYDESLTRHAGKSLSEARVFEIGYGARPYRLRAIHATGADVYGVDAEAPLLGNSPSEYLTILRRNGWERLAKTLVRHGERSNRRQRRISPRCLRSVGWRRQRPSRIGSWSAMPLIASHQDFLTLPIHLLSSSTSSGTRWNDSWRECQLG